MGAAVRFACRAIAGAALVPLLAAALPSDCTQTSTGQVPLIDMGAATYLGLPGGLYPGGANTMPPAHLAGGLTRIAEIVPRDAAGAPSLGGSIGFVFIGMSNTEIEGAAFVPLANAFPQKHPQVVVVNAAKKAQDAAAIASPTSPYWAIVDERIAAAGLTKPQVQAIWLKEAVADVALPFPQDIDLLEGYLRTIVKILRARFPNLKACWMSSRTYGGYSTLTLSPEPYAYRTAFAVRDVIEAQIAGDPALAWDPSLGPARAPWLAWGPYLWADGLVPRSDGLVWECSDFLDDGAHPSPQGAAKAANLILDFFATDATTTPWFLRPPCAPASNTSLGSGVAGAAGVPALAAGPAILGAPATTIVASQTAPFATVWFAVGLAGWDDGVAPFAGGWLHTSAEVVAPVPADGAGTALLPFVPIPDLPALCGLQLFAQVGVEDGSAPGGWALSPGLVLTIGS